MKNVLLVPCVFFLYFFFVLPVLSFFGGLAAYYALSVLESERISFLLVCIFKSACYMLMPALLYAIASVYVFLMRHSVKKYFASVFLLAICIVIVFAGIIPVCFSKLALINSMLETYSAVPAAHEALIRFTAAPHFLAALARDYSLFFEDMYAAFTMGYSYYFLFAFSVFFLICSSWGACITTKWNMFNVLLLVLFLRFFFLFYPYLHHPQVFKILTFMHLHKIDTAYRIPLMLTVATCIVNTYNAVLFFMQKDNAKKRGERS